MSLLGTGHTPQAGSTAEAEALIAEARARARRRRRRIAVAVLGAAALAAGTLAATGAFAGGRPTATAQGRSGRRDRRAVRAARVLHHGRHQPGGGYTSPEIRASATGKVVAAIPIGNVPG